MLRNSLRRNPAPAVLALGLVGLVGLAAWSGTIWFLDFLDHFEQLGQVVAERTLGSLLLVLSAAVILSALPNAVSTLFSSEDLPLLLALPQPAARVFLYKVFEVYLNTALLPTLLLLPVLFALGAHQHAPISYYLGSFAVALALFAVPVAVGVGIALPLIRFTPAGRAREWSAAASAVLGGGLIFLLRYLRPESLIGANFANPQDLDRFLRTFQDPASPLLPSSLAQKALQGLLLGQGDGALWLLLVLALGLLLLTAGVAGWAYQQGWVRALEGTVRERKRAPASWLDTLGPPWNLWLRDLRLFFRDANQVAQLLLIGILVLLYLTSLEFLPLRGAPFRLIAGLLHLGFQGFVIAAVGIRISYPLYSLEGPGFWLLQTAPLSRRAVLLTRFVLALFFLVPLGLLLGGLGPNVLGLTSLRPLSAALGAATAVLAAGLGVGLGAAFPRFQATNPAEIPLSLGGLLYMASSILGALILAGWMAPTAYPLLNGGHPLLSSWLPPLSLATLTITGLALIFGYWRMGWPES